MKLQTLDDLFLAQLQDIYDVEKRLVRALPKMAEAANNQELRNGFLEHLEQTKHHVERLEQVFQMIDSKPKAKTCPAIKGLIDEGEELIAAKGEPDVRDAGLIAGGQKVEHYEIATYGSLCTWAEQLGRDEAKSLLHQTLEEEKLTDQKLTELAEQRINIQAAQV